MKLIDFLVETKLYVGNIFEIIATITGIWYLIKSDKVSSEIKYFVYYLIFIIILEMYGYLPILAYLEDYKVLSFFEDSIFRRNIWWVNMLSVITTLCVSWIFIRSLSKFDTRKKLTILLFLFTVFSLISFTTFGDFFHANDPYVNITGVLIILVCVGFYYIDLLKSNRILTFHQDIRFYISIGMVLWNLSLVPAQIYLGFFNLENPDFINMYTKVLRYANILLYSIFTIGFIIDYRSNKGRKETLVN